MAVLLIAVVDDDPKDASMLKECGATRPPAYITRNGANVGAFGYGKCTLPPYGLIFRNRKRLSRHDLYGPCV